MLDAKYHKNPGTHRAAIEVYPEGYSKTSTGSIRLDRKISRKGLLFGRPHWKSSALVRGDYIAGDGTTTNDYVFDVSLRGLHSAKLAPKDVLVISSGGFKYVLHQPVVGNASYQTDEATIIAKLLGTLAEVQEPTPVERVCAFNEQFNEQFC